MCMHLYISDCPLRSTPIVKTGVSNSYVNEFFGYRHIQIPRDN